MQTVPLKSSPPLPQEAPERARGEVLILGIGNILQMDDGAGVHIVNSIESSASQLPEGVDIVDGGTAGYDLIPLMTGYRKIIIVDALLADGPPGSIYRFGPDMLTRKGVTFSQHDLGIRQLLDMLALADKLPEIEIIGIVPEDINTLDIGMSGSVEAALPDAIKQILED